MFLASAATDLHRINSVTFLAGREKSGRQVQLSLEEHTALK